ncbi:[protein-PII] uridylyltransferase [Roseospirillum parvum]|uniref:Bifunctional uridylyltransferase/uridylyl-removing enzyme n=1 Tax=Roseospirillum parvum TaxID=83401 RepID=A0A1G7WRR4_9PROT|nr:[protein-PII] uridylyltransferase [Roseospirillum parvum]SDG74619.1 [protein-PII] uridylyltransferase [Roseospirillum parvum]
MSHRRIKNPRAIVDRRALIARLDACFEAGPASAPATRAAVLAILKEVLAEGRAEVRRRFLEEATPGEVTVAESCHLFDRLIVTLMELALTRVYPLGVPTKGDEMALVAVGGYGRGELSPQSDLDLLFLTPYRSTPRAEQVVEYVLYMLWDLGLKVGHATRSVNDCVRLAKDDLTIATALLEARLLTGSRRLFGEFEKRYRADVVSGTETSFVEAKLKERDGRHDGHGDSRYVLEPNIKEGKGGLRDLHTLFWIARYLYDVAGMDDLVAAQVLTPGQARRFAKAQNFLWTVRCHLHYLTGRPEDRLTFDVQQEIGWRMGYTDHAGTKGVERFMKHYFLIAKDVGDLTRILCAALEEQHKRRPLVRLPFGRREADGFAVEGGRLMLPDKATLAEDPTRILELFAVAQRRDLDIHPKALRLIAENPGLVNTLRDSEQAWQRFLDMLTRPEGVETSLRRLNEAGVLGRLIPDFGRVVAQMQYDMYHVYTTDEHTIRAVGVLARIEQGRLKDELPAASSVIDKVQSRRALYVAVLLHDIAKGRGGDHSVLGAEIAHKLGPRFGLSDEETDTVAWLVLHHLDMSRTAFKRDIDDPKTIADFAALVQSPERLKLLLILTCADIRAVGPRTWNNWKATLLRELYYRTAEALSDGHAATSRDRRVTAAKRALATRLLDDQGWAEAAIERFVSMGYPNYWLAFDTETQVRHATLISEAEAAGQPLAVHLAPVPARDVTEVIVYTPDHAGLFARLAGAMALLGVSVVDAKIMTMANGMALDTFAVQGPGGGPLDDEEMPGRLKKTVEATLTGTLKVGRELLHKPHPGPSRAQVFTVPPRVIFDLEASKTHTVIEVNGRDRPGFLYDVTTTLTGLNLQISSAHISTYGERVVDVFYVKDLVGLKVDHPGRLNDIRNTLLMTLGGTPHDAEAPARGPGRGTPRRPARPRSRPRKTAAQ